MDSLTKINLDNYKPLRDVVFENLRTAILEGNLKAGQRLMEVQLAEQLGVSRTPIREAIRKLELEGLVVMLPRKGAYVANMSFKDLIDVLEIRASLEGLAAYLVAKEFETCVREADIEGVLKKDIDFHEKIFMMANNKKLYQLITSLWEQVHRFRVTYVSNYDASLSLVEEHNRILQAIKTGDGELAKKYATEHIELAEQFFMENTANS